MPIILTHKKWQRKTTGFRPWLVAAATAEVDRAAPGDAPRVAAGPAVPEDTPTEAIRRTLQEEADGNSN